MAEWIRLSETVTCASGLHCSGWVFVSSVWCWSWLLPTSQPYNQAWKLEYGHQPLMSLEGAQVDSTTETARERERGRDREREGRREGGVFVAMAKGSSSSCWFACAVAHPFPFFSSASLSPLCNRQPFRREICTLRGRLWTFLLQSFYAVRHTQGWETLSSKHREKILAGKKGYPCFSPQTGYSCYSVCGLFFFSWPSLALRQWLCIITDEPKPLEQMTGFNA